jgi:hypothetical protein
LPQECAGLCCFVRAKRDMPAQHMCIVEKYAAECVGQQMVRMRPWLPAHTWCMDWYCQSLGPGLSAQGLSSRAHTSLGQHLPWSLCWCPQTSPDVSLLTNPPEVRRGAATGAGTSPTGPTPRDNPAGATCGTWLTYTMNAVGPPHLCFLLLLQGVVQPVEPLPWRREGARSLLA